MSKRLAIVKAIAATSPHGWKYIVRNWILIRSLDGYLIRGLAVSRTSTPGEYRIYAFTAPWFTAIDPPHLSFSFEIDRSRYFDNTEGTIAEQLEPYLQRDDEACRVVFAEPNDPLHISRESWFGAGSPGGSTSRMEVAAMRALEGQTSWALQELEAVRPLMVRRTDGGVYDRERQWADEMIACLRRGDPITDLLDPWTAAAKASIKIIPVRPPARTRRAMPWRSPPAAI